MNRHATVSYFDKNYNTNILNTNSRIFLHQIYFFSLLYL
ncbi:GNAT family acetyltransferase [Bacillus albus]|uniref:GNAT family acetyltransferase n=1 Tax=Bacillus albus TaxID=2026189 RepID=A0ABM7E0Q8_9BACI|nr:GNAT family acetyltransferase [Bacillus albus]RXJ19971.1 GNAT family acetyltransferase [Bacillus albus]RXJ29952.1 GNAT family acetyltransferase [Bacillus albus]RXJ31544.1 GNAT family acetyltransferase [Bacillus albus]RXJ42768.1 GNAT family acetyltransferase [Bacillus albus]